MDFEILIPSQILNLDLVFGFFIAMATAGATAKRKPVFIKVDQLKPGTTGHTLTVKVVSSKPVQVNKPRGARSLSSLSQPSRPPRIAECLVGDDTGAIYFTARNDQG